ncbi:MAG: HAD-IA family hydrolase [Gemmatimonadaceae bacterium]|nr:HAD-IA family hydrolase [Gemmatimonadaceae bacterium]
MPYRVVLFDLDGTLADTIELIVRSGQHAFTTVLGWSPSREEILRGLGRPLASHLGDYASSAQQLDAIIAAYRSFQMANHDRLTRPYAGVNDVVHWLRDDGRPLGVVTSKIETLAHRALTCIGIDACFEIVVGLESTATHKPGPEPVLFAMQRLGAAAAETVYVGDSPFDLDAANAAGVASIGVTWGAFGEADLRAHRPTHVAHSASDLRTLLQ